LSGDRPLLDWAISLTVAQLWQARTVQIVVEPSVD